MRRASRQGAGWLFLLNSIWLAAPCAVAQAPDPCTPPAGDTGFVEIEANIFAGTFGQVLPFDVPLRFCAKVPQGTKTMALKVVESRTEKDLDEDSCVTPPVGDPWGQALAGRVDDQSSSTVTAARVVAPPLKAQRFYSFCFLLDRPLTAAEMAEVIPAIKDAFDAKLAEIGSGNLTEAQYQAHMASLAAEIEKRALAITDAEKVSAGFDELVAGTLEPQLRTRLLRQGNLAGSPDPAAAAIATNQAALAAALAELEGNPALAAFVQALRSAAVSDPILRDLLDKNYASALALTGLTSDQVTALAAGQDPAASAGSTLATAATAEAATAAGARFDGTNQALGSLRELATKMTATGGPVVVVNALSASDRATLAQLLAEGGALTRAEDLTFTLSGQAGQLARALGEREAALAAFFNGLDLAARRIFVADGTTSGNFKTATNFYVSADAGLVWSPEVDEVVPYVGTNIYLRPVNKDASLRTLGSFGQTFTRRFALTLGLTASSIADTDGGTSGVTRDDLFGSQSLLVGAGLRITDMIRLGTGALIFKQQDPNPLINDETTGRALYFTVSFDLDVAGAFKGGLGALLTGGR